MSRMLSRRKMMLGVGGAVAVSPLAFAGSAAAADPTGPLHVLLTPQRLYDSRTDAVPLGGAKLASGASVIVTAILTPLLTSWWYRKVTNERLAREKITFTTEDTEDTEKLVKTTL